MKKIILLIGFILFSVSAYSVDQTIVATVSGGQVAWATSESTLINAWEDELNDGTTIDSVAIEYDDDNQVYYLTSYGSNESEIKGCCYRLSIDGNGNLTLNTDIGYSICSTVTCIGYGFFCCIPTWICNCNGCGGPGASCQKSSNYSPTSGTGYLGSFY